MLPIVNIYPNNDTIDTTKEWICLYGYVYNNGDINNNNDNNIYSQKDAYQGKYDQIVQFTKIMYQ